MTALAPAPVVAAGSAGQGLRTMVRRQLRANRTSTIVMAVLVAIANAVQIQAYTSVFPSAASRDALLLPFASNAGLRVLYGYPFDIGDVTGWVSWRSVSFVGLVLAVWAIMITCGALRGEEDAGRGEITLSQPQPRARWFAAAVCAVAIETAVIGVVSTAAMAVVGVGNHLMSVANSVELGLQVSLPAILFGAIAALACQLWGTVRAARLWAGAVLAVAFGIRAVADTGTGLGWLRWVSPLGWFEELRPPQPPGVVPLVVILGTSAVVVAAALPLLARRDIGLGVLAQSDSRPPRRFLLRTPWQAALRDELPQLATWLVVTMAMTALMGGLIKTVLDLVNQNPVMARVTGAEVGVNAFVAAMFSLIQVIAALLVVTLVAGARGEEATGRLELLLAMPRARLGWLAGRVVLAAGLAALLCLLAALAMWAGAAATGQHVALGALLAATGNSLPVVVVTAGFATAVLGLAPRAVSAGYAVVAVAYLWDALGTALRAPHWTLELSPFHALAQVPLQHVAVTPVLVLCALGLALFGAGAAAFRRRDLAAG
ncbi:hypothetical protein HFP15_14105 [Amycolatopsis sp. K13G38]|uniref:ABC transporter permease n=1 Tax=Amycolatopsis acididurans TaxID=2724524 RepID=A0ABX1J2M6_9PSEU|nr:hypothetical protein [Amycolatopsis acididurans]NKQ54017.1 hypothetical protein [Amycolatopsis acididurans]